MCQLVLLMVCVHNSESAVETDVVTAALSAAMRSWWPHLAHPDPPRLSSEAAHSSAEKSKQLLRPELACASRPAWFVLRSVGGDRGQCLKYTVDGRSCLPTHCVERLIEPQKQGVCSTLQGRGVVRNRSALVCTSARAWTRASIVEHAHTWQQGLCSSITAVDSCETPMSW